MKPDPVKPPIDEGIASIILQSQVDMLRYCARECEEIAMGEERPLMMTAKYFRALADSAEAMRQFRVEDVQWPKPPVGD